MAYRKSCILLFTLQQDCNTRKACRLFIVVKVVQVVFHYKQELLSPRRFHFMVPFLAMAKFELCLSMAYRKSCIMLFTLQQDCNTRIACRLLFVVKVVQVVFHYKQELLSPRRFHFMVPFLAMAKFELCLSMAYRKSCIMLFTLQQDCNTRVACRLLFVVKVVQVVFPYSAGKHTRWLSTQQAAFPPPLHFIAHYRTGSHGSASYRTTGEEKSHNFALGNAYRQA